MVTGPSFIRATFISAPKYPVFIDESARMFEFMTVNAGQRGLLFKLKPDDLIAATGAKTAGIVR